MRVSASGFLTNYRWHFAAIVLERVVNVVMLVLAAINPGGTTYLIFYRIYLVQWSAMLYLLVVVELNLGIKMRRKLKSLGSTTAVIRVRLIICVRSGFIPFI
jgi:hypothetical protein